MEHQRNTFMQFNIPKKLTLFYNEFRRKNFEKPLESISYYFDVKLDIFSP